MEDNEIQEGGISLGDIFRTIFSQKWLALVLFVLITIAGTVGLYYTGKAKTYYVISFSLNLPGAVETESFYRYPDGNKFYYADYVSTDVLEKVQSSDKAFSDIDIAGAVKSGEVKFSETYTKVESIDDKNAESTVTIRRVFDVGIKTTAFVNDDQARSYLKTLAMYPIDLFSEMNINYNVYLNQSDFDDALTFSKQIEYLQSQITFIDSRYASLTNVTDDEGNLISSKRQQFNAWVARLDLESLLNEESANHYLKDWETSLKKFEDELVLLNQQIEDAENNLNAVKSVVSSGSTLPDDTATVISNLQAKLTALQREKTTIEDYKNAYYTNGSLNQTQVKATEQFAAKIRDIYNELTGENGFISAYTELSKDVYEKDATVSFLTPNYISSEGGGYGLFKSLLFSLVAGIVVALVVAYIVGYCVQKKSSKKAQTQPVAVFAQAQAQAAATQDETDNEEKDK